MSRTQRNLLLAVALIAIVVLVGRHGNLFHSSSTTTTTAAATTTTTTTTTSSTTAATTTTTTATAATTCRGADFSGVNVGSQGAAGTGYDIMTLTKVTAGSCVVDGYPVLSFQDAKGTLETSLSVVHSTSFPAAPANAGAVAYTIADGGRVDVQFRYSDVPSGTETCPSVAQVNVQFVPGDTSVPVSFPYVISPCSSAQVGVSAFYPG